MHVHATAEKCHLAKHTECHDGISLESSQHKNDNRTKTGRTL